MGWSKGVGEYSVQVEGNRGIRNLLLSLEEN